MAKCPVEVPHGAVRRENDSGMANLSGVHGVRMPPSDTSANASTSATLRTTPTSLATSSSSNSGNSGSCDDDDDDVASWTPVPTAALAIPTFRKCRTTSSSFDEWRHHRSRTVSGNSVASTTSCQSSFSTSSTGEEDEMHQATNCVAPTLPSAPYPVDPYHFYCRGANETTMLVQELRQLLKECDIESSFQPHKCKFKCVKYVHYSHVEFIVRVYTSGDALLLEFQRRSGSLLLWDGLYSVLFHRLSHWVDQAAAACPQSGTQKKVAPRDEDSINVKVWNKLSTASQTPTSGVEAMKIMVTSPFLDAQREGCSGLAVITEDAESSYQVAKYGIVEYLVSAAASNDLEMARCAIGALGNVSRALATFPDHKLAARTLDQIKHAARVVVELLSHTTDSLFSLELLRECARALGRFGKICPNEVMVCEGPEQLLHHVNHRDHQLSTLCREALLELEANV